MNPIRFGGTLIRNNNGTPVISIRRDNSPAGCVDREDSDVNLPNNGLMESLEVEIEKSHGKTVGPDQLKQWATQARDHLAEYFYDLQLGANGESLRARSTYWGEAPRDFDGKALTGDTLNDHKSWVDNVLSGLMGRVTVMHRLTPENQAHQLMLVPGLVHEESVKAMGVDYTVVLEEPPEAVKTYRMQDMLARMLEGKR